MPVDLKEVLESLPDGIVVLDRSGQVVEINAEACRILECSAEVIFGKVLGEALDGSKTPKEALERLAMEHEMILRTTCAAKCFSPLFAKKYIFLRIKCFRKVVLPAADFLLTF